MALLDAAQIESALSFLSWFTVLTVAAADVAWCQYRAWKRYPWPTWARRRR